MQKINIIIPIIENNFDLSLKTKELKAFLKDYEGEYNVFFVANFMFENLNNYKNLKDYKLIETKLKTVNELINKGFEEVEKGEVIILDAQEENYIKTLGVFLENKTDSNIILCKPTHKKSKIKSYFEKVFIKLYYAYLKFWGLEKDLLCSNTNQYFNKDVVKVIKSLNKKNAYLRNFETLSGYEFKIIKEEVKITNESVKLLSFKNNNTLIGVIAFILGFMFLVASLIFTNLILSINNGIGYYFLILAVSFITMFLSGYLIVKDVIKDRGNL